ncbi:MAG: translation initiation factor IF-3 [Bacteroidales bacterium]|nr:translation initiation factor IF-3 [Bacteroidales bacterium]
MATPFFNKGGNNPYQRRDNRFRKKEDAHKINDRITVTHVRLVGNNIEPGIFPTARALEIASELGLDLVEISPNANPPVCKVIDYKKFLYEQKKKQKELKSKTAQVITKELRFTPNTDEHDFNFKLNHAIKFLKEGAKVKADVFFKGRSILYKEQGEIMLLKLAAALEEWGKVEQLPRLEGKRMMMIITPKKK